ncbi:MAG: hypothetical protein JWQ04_2568 [Pedosphaera sp.]|nr:hypothetical protein [Pedosphaera sp.]
MAETAAAQTFQTLHKFDNGGYNPQGALIISSNRIYGVTTYGGSFGSGGTVFAANTDGTTYSNLHSFSASYDPNGDGAEPYAGLVLSGGVLYGTAYVGGASGSGGVFKLNTDGSGFTTLHSFTSNNPYAISGGAYPLGMILQGNTLYGVTHGGGIMNNGTIFSINLDGSGFTNLYNFTATSGSYPTNNDGSHPVGRLVLSGGAGGELMQGTNTLYGATEEGGIMGGGTVFSIHTDGTHFTNLHNFGGNGDGAIPRGSLILSAGTLYGTAENGGSSGNGSVFAVSIDGAYYTILHSFTDNPYYTNSDGRAPLAGLFLSGSTLYGTTLVAGGLGCGTVFAVNTNGTDFTILYTFTGGFDGAAPWAGVILSGNTLYGTTDNGNYTNGTGDGTMFALSLAPQLNMSMSGPNAILTWPTNVAGFDYTGITLQCTTSLVPPVVWSTVSPPPVVVNGQSTVTNNISGAQMFYRLSQ